MNSQPPLRVVLWGTYDIGKPRVRILRSGLRARGVEVIECHEDLWRGIEDKSQVKNPLRWLWLLGKALLAYPRLVFNYLRLPKHDIVLLCYPGLVDLFVLRLFAWLRGTPIAWDWFLSAYDTIVLDRRLLSRGNIASHAIRAAEWIGCRLADVVFMDTATHARRMEELFGLDQGRIGRVWVGAEQDHFVVDQPDGEAVTIVPAQSATPTVLFYGQFIPLHGVDTIMEAARLLKHHDINWTIIGKGQVSADLDRQLLQAPLPRVTRIFWVDYASLQQHLSAATVALGIFGTSKKAAAIIPNKIFQVLCAGRPLITRESHAMNELLPPNTPGVQLVPPGDAPALARAVLAAVNQSPLPDPQLLPAFDELAIATQLLDLLTPHIKAHS